MEKAISCRSISIFNATDNHCKSNKVRALSNHYLSLIFLIFNFFFFNMHTSVICFASGVIYPNTRLTPSSSSSWTSSSGTFSMGFFSFEPHIFYVGIWYSSLPMNDSIIWTANRNQSVTEDSSLQFTPNGQLQLINSSSEASISSSHRVWEASSTIAASQAELLENGNFVLRDNTSTVIWQSFDHPTDTLLPGQNFTMSSKSPSLVPWVSNTSPSPSTKYSLVFGEVQQLIGHVRLLYESKYEYWSVPSSTSISLFNSTFTLNATGAVSVYNGDGELMWSQASCVNLNMFSKLQLSVDGNLRLLSWYDDSKTWGTLWRALYRQCGVYGACGDNGICNDIQNQNSVVGGGCPEPEPTTEQICSCPQGFMGVAPNCTSPALDCSQSYISLPNTTFGPLADKAPYTNIGQQDCINICLSNCNCSAATYNASSSECWIQEGLSLFNGFTSSQATKTSFIRSVAARESKSSLPAYAIVLIVAGSLILLILIFAGLLIKYQYTSRFYKFKEVLLPDMLDRLGAPKRFTFEDLYMVTRGFAHENKLGSGGFGSVYRGTFTTQDGKLEVAIKRLYVQRQGLLNEDDHGKEESDFLVEIETLGSIRHVNVVSLIGFCAQGPERLLVYEYVANGSLNDHLFSKSTDLLNWHDRFQIAVGAAMGIEYLHTQCPKKIVHRDIKPHNILIDEDFKPKVADFGISQIMGPDRDHLTNNNLHGTPTYMAPERWRVGALVTEKEDAYSFGVVILEIVSGKMVRKKHEYMNGKEDVGEQGRGRVLFLHEALEMMEEKRWESLVDERLEGVYDREDAERLVKIVFWCLQGKAEQRPYMEDLLLMIKGHKAVPQPPLLGLLDVPLGLINANHYASSSQQSNIQLPEEYLSQGR